MMKQFKRMYAMLILLVHHSRDVRAGINDVFYEWQNY